MKHLFNLTFIAIFSFAGSGLFAQSETIDFKQYSISLQKKGAKDIQQIKIKEQAALDFDVSAYISEHIQDYTINIWATIKTDDTRAQYRFNSKELIEGRDCSVFCEELLEIERQALLGVTAKDHDAFQGAIIGSVVTKSAAEKAGLLADDLITYVGVFPIHNGCDLRIAIHNYNVGDEVPVTFVRNGKTRKVNAILGYKLLKKMTWVPCCDNPLARVDLPGIVGGAAMKSELKLFPNPTAGASHIHFISDLDAPIQILVSDVNGRQVFSQEYADFDGTLDRYLDMTEEAAGIFFVTVIQGEAVFVERLVVVTK